jgi:hypothetical protein
LPVNFFRKFNVSLPRFYLTWAYGAPADGQPGAGPQKEEAMTMVRYGTLGFVVLGLIALPGCAQRLAPAPAMPAAVAAKPRAPAFTLDTPVEHIAANRRGKAILERDLPGLMASRSYLLFDDMSLSEIASLSSGQLTQTKLDRVAADLSQLSQ